MQLLLKSLLLCSLVAGIWGCSSATPATRYYLLSDPAQEIALDSGCSVRLGSASVAPYLQRTHIMLASGANELVPALQHRWSEPLEAGVTRLLSRCLGGNRDADYRVNVVLDHLHGNVDGTVVLQARWSSTGSSQVDAVQPLEDQFSARRPQSSAGYDALVSTQRALVLELCVNIKASISSC